MTMKELSRRLLEVANLLIGGSLFFVLIWWRVAVYLFAAGSIIGVAAWLIDQAPFGLRFTTPE